MISVTGVDAVIDYKAVTTVVPECVLSPAPTVQPCRPSVAWQDAAPPPPHQAAANRALAGLLATWRTEAQPCHVASIPVRRGSLGCDRHSPSETNWLEPTVSPTGTWLAVETLVAWSDTPKARDLAFYLLALRADGTAADNVTASVLQSARARLYSKRDDVPLGEYELGLTVVRMPWDEVDEGESYACVALDRAALLAAAATLGDPLPRGGGVRGQLWLDIELSFTNQRVVTVTEALPPMRYSDRRGFTSTPSP